MRHKKKVKQMARKKRKRPRTLTLRKRARSRGAYEFAPVGRSTRAASRKRSSGARTGGISSVTSAATATLIFWLTEAVAQYGMKAMNITTPKSRALVPGLIALLAYKGYIKTPGLLPIAIAQTMNTIKETSPAIQNAFTFDGMGERPRTYAETIAAIQQSSPNPMSQYQGLRVGTVPRYNGMSLGKLPSYNGSGYNQPNANI